MTPQIQEWMRNIVRPMINNPGRVLEIGSLNINGGVRQFFSDSTEYIGTDMEAGEGVDVVMNNSKLIVEFAGESFDTVIACEVLEHDVDYYHTLVSMRRLLKSGGHLIITTPTFGFPLHRYPKDYWRFGEDAYRDVFFSYMDILDLRHLDNDYAPQITLAGIAQKK